MFPMADGFIFWQVQGCWLRLDVAVQSWTCTVCQSICGAYACWMSMPA